ncbi:MAG: DUF3108 domain-containing protein [Verrucomicrobiota bacterium]
MAKSQGLLCREKAFRPAILVTLLSVFLCGSTLASGGTSPTGAVVGEKALYKLKWGVVGVGEVEIRLDEVSEEAGLVEATLDAKANAFMRRFYDFHTIIKSRFAPDLEESLGYSRDETASENLHETIFDWENGIVRYSKNGDVRNPIPLQPLCQDPLSIVFAFRSGAVPCSVGTHRVWVTDGKVIDQIEFKVSGPEKLRVPAGKFSALKITADFLGVRAIFARPEGALIDVWLTDDERMIPIKLKSEAKIGSFRSELEEYWVDGEQVL